MSKAKKPRRIDMASDPDTRSCIRCGGVLPEGVTYAHKTPPAGDNVPDAFAGLDAGIAPYVRTLWENGIETYESCQGGDDPERPEGGHAYPQPTIAFHGDASVGYRAFAIAKYFGLPVWELRRVWRMHDGELEGPTWHMTFRYLAPETSNAES